MWYILLATAFIFVLDATTGLEHGILLQILLGFILIFHLRSIMIDGNRGMLNLKNFCCFVAFQFLVLCVLYFRFYTFQFLVFQPTKIMFVDTKYKSAKQILY